MKKKSVFILFALALACALVLAGCDNGTTSSSSSGPSLPAGAVSFLNNKGIPVFPPPEGLSIDPEWNDVIPTEGFEIGYKDGNEDLFDAYIDKVTSILGATNLTDDDDTSDRHIVKFSRSGVDIMFAFSKGSIFQVHSDTVPENMILIQAF